MIVLSISHWTNPQGQNVDQEEFTALAHFLTLDDFALPDAQEYQNDLVQPQIATIPGVPPSRSTTIMPAAICTPKPQPNDPATEDQWKRSAKMVA